jgi:hypothetical protein
MQGRATSMTRSLLVFLGALGISACSSDHRTVVGTGAISLTWMIVVDGQVSDCSDPAVDADVVQVVSRGATTFKDTFECLNESGTTGDIDDDVYDVTVHLLRCPNTDTGCPGGVDVHDAVTFPNIDVVTNQVTPLGNVQWQF